ncbi:MAG: hypothetical protein GTN53_37670 [Candidatus Aminicenantes bacterium]|nr:hypothetical protein [Candidatus Aminicenantes bacterium]NIQ72212.1 hypothetical protein [Candidatus Aminicenantes bacterium]NIT28248.1 hypothetical protein [Candidatus Aminicenantes bacterium]
MAVKKKTTVPPPQYKTGGKMQHYAIEVLECERDLILSRLKSIKSEASKYKQDRKEEISNWQRQAGQLQGAIAYLKSNKAALARESRPPDIRKGCKKIAACKEQSYIFCIKKCIKRRDRSCDLVRYRKK